MEYCCWFFKSTNNQPSLSAPTMATTSDSSALPGAIITNAGSAPPVAIITNAGSAPPVAITDAMIRDQMTSPKWIRQCCTKLLALDEQLSLDAPMSQLSLDAPKAIDHAIVNTLRKFLMCEGASLLDRVTMCNTFVSVYKFVDGALNGKYKPEELRAAGTRALAQDIAFNVYDIWIHYLFSNVPPGYAKAAAAATKRSIAVPSNPWVTAYAVDPLIRALETLFAKHMPLVMPAGVVMIRLNGEM